jgi:hypothetical protein
MTEYKHSIAHYPHKYLGSVVSPRKICLQFKKVLSKCRVAYRDESDLLKRPDGRIALPLTVEGDYVDIVANGVPIAEIVELQKDLLKSYKLYIKQYADYYKEDTGKVFKDEIETLLRDYLNEGHE